LDTVNTQTAQPGMKRAVLFITPHMDDPNIDNTIAPLIQKAVESKIRVFVWFVDAEDYGVTAMFLSAMFLCGVILPVVRRWELPFGAITLILVVHMVFMTVLSDTFFFIPAALIAGLVADLLALRLKPW
jgi:hypothetical protein